MQLNDPCQKRIIIFYNHQPFCLPFSAYIRSFTPLRAAAKWFFVRSVRAHTKYTPLAWSEGIVNVKNVCFI